MFIMANAIFIGVTSQQYLWSAVQEYSDSESGVDSFPHRENADLIRGMDIAFNSLFAVELLVRMAAEEFQFVFGEDVGSSCEGLCGGSVLRALCLDCSSRLHGGVIPVCEEPPTCHVSTINSASPHLPSTLTAEPTQIRP